MYLNLKHTNIVTMTLHRAAEAVVQHRLHRDVMYRRLTRDRKLRVNVQKWAEHNRNCTGGFSAKCRSAMASYPTQVLSVSS